MMDILPQVAPLSTKGPASPKVKRQGTTITNRAFTFEETDKELQAHQDLLQECLVTAKSDVDAEKTEEPVPTKQRVPAASAPIVVNGDQLETSESLIPVRDDPGLADKAPNDDLTPQSRDFVRSIGSKVNEFRQSFLNASRENMYLRKDVACLSEEKDTVLEKNGELQKRVLEKESETISLQTKIRGLESTGRIQSEELAEKRSKLAELNRTVVQQGHQIQKHRILTEQNHASQRGTIEHQKKHIARLQQQLKRQLGTIESQKKRIEEVIPNVEEMNQKLHSTQVTNCRLEQYSRSLLQELEQRKTESAEKLRSLNWKRKDLEKTVNTLHESADELLTAKDRIAELENKESAAIENQRVMREQIDGLKYVLEKSTREVAELQMKLKKSDAELDCARRDVTHLRSENELSRMEREDNATRLTDMGAEVADLTAQRERIARDNESLRKDVRTLAAERDSVKSQLLDFVKRRNTDEKHMQSEIDRLGKDLSHFKTAARSAMCAEERNHAIVIKGQRELKEVRAELKAVKEELDDTKKKKKTLSNALMAEIGQWQRKTEKPDKTSVAKQTVPQVVVEKQEPRKQAIPGGTADKPNPNSRQNSSSDQKKQLWLDLMSDPQSAPMIDEID